MTKKLTAGILLLMILILSGPAVTAVTIAQEGGPVVLTDATSQYPLGLHLEILEDPGGQLTIEQVASAQYGAQFVPSQDKVPNFGYTDSAYWVRFGVRNETAETRDWRLELGFPNMQHAALYTTLSQPGGTEPGWAEAQTGTFYPFSTRDEAFHRIVFDLSLPVQAEGTLYLRFQNDASMTLPLTLWSAAAFAQHSRSDMFMWGILYGVLLITFGRNALLFLSLRDKNYLFYTLFLGAFLLFQASFAGHAQQVLWPNLVAWNRFAVPASSAAIPTTALLFTASFLELRARAPRLNRALVVLLVVLGIILLLTPFLSYRLLIRPIVALVIGSFVLMLVSGFAVWRRGYRPARYYGLSWTAFLVSATVMALARYGLLPSTALTEQSYLAGFVLAVLLMALALADRIRLLEVEAEEADRELRESESRLQQYLEAMPVGVTVRDAESHLQYANRRARQLRNWPEELPTDTSDWEGTLEETLEETIEEIPLYLSGTQQAYPIERLPPMRALRGEPASVEDAELERGGQRIPLEIWSSPVLDEQGRVQYAVSAFRDISERVRNQHRIEDQLAVEKTLATISSRFVETADLDQAISETLAEIGRLLRFDHLFLVRLRPDRGQMEMTHEWCAPGLPSLLTELQGVPLENVPWLLGTLRGGDMVFVNEPSELPPEAAEEKQFVQRHLRGRLCILPVWVGGELDGFLACHSHSVAAPRFESEASVLETVGGIVSSALGRARVLETLEKRVADRTRELGSLYRVTILTSTLQPLEATLGHSLEVILMALNCAMGAIHLREGREAALRLIAEQGLPREALDELASGVTEGALWQQVLAQDRPLMLAKDPCAEPSILPWACLADVTAYVGVPIVAGGEPIGVLSIFVQSDRGPTAEEMALLMTIADQLGTAVESDRLRLRAEEARVMQERQRLARDLHDAVTQSLYSLTLFAEAATDMCRDGDMDKAHQYLARIAQMAHHALKEMRLLIYQLRPSTLEHEGLVGALAQRLEAVERRAGMDVRLITSQGRLGLPLAVEEALYRIAQEALNNVLKHAAATEVEIALDEADGAIGLAVRDNGQGVDLESAHQAGGMGLANIRQRVEELGGTLAITSTPGQGTEVRASVPVTWRQEPEEEVTKSTGESSR